MAKMHLTDIAVERLRRPQKGRTEVSDSEPGLFLWISPNGTKSWVVRRRAANGGEPISRTTPPIASLGAIIAGSPRSDEK